MLGTERAKFIQGLINDVPLLDKDQGKDQKIFTLATRFVEMINGSRLIEDIAKTEVAPDCEMPKGCLTLTHSLLREDTHPGGDLHRHQQFYLEGTDFILYLGKPQNGNAACVCFIKGDDLEYYRKKGLMVSGSDKSLAINQLQGLSGADFGPIRWEMVLVKIVGLFARSVGFQDLMIIPAQFNRYWAQSNPDLNQRLLIRYDGTAKRLGFKREGLNHPYVFDFSEDDARSRQIISTYH